MTMEVFADELPDERSVVDFSQHLEAYADTLNERERHALSVLLLRAMDPVERMRLRETETLLNEREQAVLRALEADRER